MWSSSYREWEQAQGKKKSFELLHKYRMQPWQLPNLPNIPSLLILVQKWFPSKGKSKDYHALIIMREHKILSKTERIVVHIFGGN